jgi:hypothetical protein
LLDETVPLRPQVNYEHNSDMEKRLIKVPSRLDLTPYRDEKDFPILQELVRKKKARK